MNLDGKCPNRHFADCDICVPNGNELKRQEEEKKKEMIDIGYVPKEDIVDGLLVRFDRETSAFTMFAYADIKKGERYYAYPREDRKVIGVYKIL